MIVTATSGSNHSGKEQAQNDEVDNQGNDDEELDLELRL